jgi:triosephosphate isomerase (TIM)
MVERRKLIAGNWKMNGLVAAVSELRAMSAGASELAGRVDLAICPPALIAGAAKSGLPPRGVRSAYG